MSRPRLYLSHAPDRGYLYGLEYGTVPDGQPPECWHPVGEEFDFFRLGPGGPIVGFRVGLRSFDPEDPELSETWDEPLFDVPLVGLRGAPAAAIVAAAKMHFGERPSLNRALFDQAVVQTGEEALRSWRVCLEAGDSMAHFALGYTLYDLERFEEAYRHLRYYAEIAPNEAWNWCWFGKAAEAVGASAEARMAYQRAVQLEEAGCDLTEAHELLLALDEVDSS
jgi:tetratricopeptide (TPR) repeat protein